MVNFGYIQVLNLTLVVFIIYQLQTPWPRYHYFTSYLAMACLSPLCRNCKINLILIFFLNSFMYKSIYIATRNKRNCTLQLYCVFHVQSSNIIVTSHERHGFSDSSPIRLLVETVVEANSKIQQGFVLLYLLWRESTGHWGWIASERASALQWRHNGHDNVSNHQPYDCLLNRLFKRRSKKKIKDPRHWPVCGEFTSDRWCPRTNGQ